MNKTLKKVLNIALDVILGLVVLFAILGIIYGLSAKKSKNGVPTIFGKSAFVVPTTSMDTNKNDRVQIASELSISLKDLKYIHKGDLVFGDSSVPYNDLKVGDVIFFKGYLTDTDKEKTIIVHRIVKINYKSDGVTVATVETRGDNPLIPDSDTQTVIYGDYIAKLSSKVSSLGYGVMFLTGNDWINYTRKDGTIIPFLKTLHDFNLSIGFALVIILPILIYVILTVIKLIKVLQENSKLDAMNNEVQDDEFKKAIIEEYLKQQELNKKEEKVEADSTNKENKE